MKRKFSKAGLILIAIFVVLIGLSVIFAPFTDFGTSLAVIPLLSRPWNKFIIRFVDLKHEDYNVFAVLPGLLINAAFLYIIGYGLEKLVGRQKPN